jgi:hypothetical protein
MLVYSNSEKYYVTGHTCKYAQVLRYRQTKKRCLFKHCNYPHLDALDNGVLYVEYYLNECLDFKFVANTQARILDAFQVDHEDPDWTPWDELEEENSCAEEDLKKEKTVQVN